MKKYHIRFNHQHENSNKVWRIFEDGIEHLVEHLDIQVPMRDEVTVENGIQKWNVYCEGYMTIENGTASITKHPKFDWRKPTVQMLGRWQPWHAGHRALFEEALKKTGQVCIMIRDCQDWNQSNPFDIEQVKGFIREDLDPDYKGMYEILVVPNIVDIVYGRNVGYTFTEVQLPENIQKISGTKIREELGLK